ncbi:MAG: VOC family protein [Acidimicrobiales bacterium]|jgi:catechol 2,3-dioxygenase-like lactoylglutathione lyase family enzyme|nr:VOC family protein [Acidimicrobiales bacterium]
MPPPSLRLGHLDHVHIRVPDRVEAAAWYAEHLGFEPVEEYRFWAEGFGGGPLQITGDGGGTSLALFEASETHPMAPNLAGVAFSVDHEAFVAFARSLPGVIPNVGGTPLASDELIDFDLCWAYEFADPWGNRYELNCYDYDEVRLDLIERDRIRPVRYWPRELYDEWRQA